MRQFEAIKIEDISSILVQLWSCKDQWNRGAARKAQEEQRTCDGSTTNFEIYKSKNFNLHACL